MKLQYIYGLISAIAMTVYPSVVQASNNGPSRVVEVSHPFDILESTNQMASWYDLNTNYYTATNPTGNLFFRGLNEETNQPVTNSVNVYAVHWQTNGSVVTATNMILDDSFSISGTNITETTVYPDERGAGYFYEFSFDWPPYGTHNDLVILYITEGQLINGAWRTGPTQMVTNPPEYIYATMPYFYNFNAPVNIRVTNR